MMEYVFPKDNEKEFVEIAKRLGIREICFVYNKIKDVSSYSCEGLNVSCGVLCNYRNVRKFECETLIDAFEDREHIRAILESGPSVVFNLEKCARKDFMHNRGSGLNQVLAKIMVEKQVKWGVSFSSLLNCDLRKKAIFMGRMRQNMLLARKYGVEPAIASFSKNPYELRNKHMMQAFRNLLVSKGGTI